MKIVIGSNNDKKIIAVQQEFLSYEEFSDALFEGTNAESLVASQPMSLDETIQGAKNRARAAFLEGDLGVGIESGLLYSKEIPTNYYNTVQCAIYDGKEFFIGGGMNYYYPQKVIEAVLEGHEISQAYKVAGLINEDEPKIGYYKGAIHLVSKGRMDRVEYMRPAIQSALFQYFSKK